MKYGYDWLDEDDKLQTVWTGEDQETARRGAVKMSKKHGSAAMLFIRDGETVGAVTYVEGRTSSKEGEAIHRPRA